MIHGWTYEQKDGVLRGGGRTICSGDATHQDIRLLHHIFQHIQGNVIESAELDTCEGSLNLVNQVIASCKNMSTAIE